MKTISRYIMTLALLLTAVTGAWAQSSPNVVEFEVPADWQGDESPVTAADLPGFKASTFFEASAWTGAPKTDAVMLVYAFNGGVASFVSFENGDASGGMDYTASKDGIYSMKSDYKFYYTKDPDAIDFKWDAAKKTGTFTMPAFDVEIAPIYAPVAQWATEGTEPEVKTLLPEAAEGVIADTDAPLIVEGTVAFAGTSTEVKQGIVMYAVTPATITEAPALDAANKWSADVPTAKLVADGGVDVKVWYYIKGADAPEGQEATAENTFNDSEICATPITVTVLSNKFDIEFKAANANTIETGKATVTVGGTAKTVTEGKLTGVKMGSEVKVKAKDGYKFRKVEVKKGATTSSQLSAVTSEDIGKVVCAAGHLHDAKTAVPDGCTAVGILGKVTETGHGLILALQDATNQTWNTINGWTSATDFAGTTLKVLPDDDARGTNLTSYTTLGETAVSNWAVAQKSDYEAIFTNLGSTMGDNYGKTYDDHVEAYITTGVGGAAISGAHWSATEYSDTNAFVFYPYYYWYPGENNKTSGYRVRPVLGF